MHRFEIVKNSVLRQHTFVNEFITTCNQIFLRYQLLVVQLAFQFADQRCGGLLHDFAKLVAKLFFLDLKATMCERDDVFNLVCGVPSELEFREYVELCFINIIVELDFTS